MDFDPRDYDSRDDERFDLIRVVDLLSTRNADRPRIDGRVVKTCAVDRAAALQPRKCFGRQGLAQFFGAWQNMGDRAWREKKAEAVGRA